MKDLFWSVPDADIPQAVQGWVRDVETRYSARYDTIRNAYKIVGDPVDEELTVETYEFRKPIVASAKRSLIAQISTFQPRAMFSTVGGTYSQQQRARKLTRYSDARMIDLGAQAILDATFDDGLTAGLGVARPYVDRIWKTLRLERVHPLDVLIDDASCVGYEPRTAVTRRLMDKRILMDLNPKHAADIEGAPAAKPHDRRAGESGDNLVCVYECSHLQSRPDSKDGLICTVVGDVLLSKHRYERDTHPLVWVRPFERSYGWWGLSLVIHLWPQQRLHDNLCENLDEGVERIAIPRWFMKSGDFVKAHMNDIIGAIVETKTGNPPHLSMPPAMGADMVQLMKFIEEGVYDTAGTSKDFATQQKPAGVTASIAMLTYRDMQTQAHVRPARAYERAYVDLAWELVANERTLSELVDGYKVPVLDGSRRKSFKWSELDLDDELLRVQAFPTSALPREPAARLERLEEMLSSQIIDLEQFWTLAEMPDTEGAIDFFTSPVVILRKRFDEMLESGKYRGPEPYMDHKRALKYCALAIQQAENTDVEESKIDLLRRFYSEIKKFLSMGGPPPPPMPGEGMPLPVDPMMQGAPWPSQQPPMPGQPPLPPELPAPPMPMGPEGMPPMPMPPVAA